LSDAVFRFSNGIGRFIPVFASASRLAPPRCGVTLAQVVRNGDGSFRRHDGSIIEEADRAAVAFAFTAEQPGQDGRIDPAIDRPRLDGIAA